MTASGAATVPFKVPTAARHPPARRATDRSGSDGDLRRETAGSSRRGRQVPPGLSASPPTRVRSRPGSASAAPHHRLRLLLPLRRRRERVQISWLTVAAAAAAAVLVGMRTGVEAGVARPSQEEEGARVRWRGRWLLLLAAARRWRWRGRWTGWIRCLPRVSRQSSRGGGGVDGGSLGVGVEARVGGRKSFRRSFRRWVWGGVLPLPGAFCCVCCVCCSLL